VLSPIIHATKPTLVSHPAAPSQAPSLFLLSFSLRRRTLFFDAPRFSFDISLVFFFSFRIPELSLFPNIPNLTFSFFFLFCEKNSKTLIFNHLLSCSRLPALFYQNAEITFPHLVRARLDPCLRLVPVSFEKVPLGTQPPNSLLFIFSVDPTCFSICPIPLEICVRESLQTPVNSSFFLTFLRLLSNFRFLFLTLLRRMMVRKVPFLPYRGSWSLSYVTFHV